MNEGNGEERVVSLSILTGSNSTNLVDVVEEIFGAGRSTGVWKKWRKL